MVDSCYNNGMEYTLITGATGYLGKAFACECLKRKQNLYLTGRSEDRLTLLREELLSLYPARDIQIFPCDLSDEKSRAALYSDAENYKFSRLINVAGADIQKAFYLYDEQKLTFQIRANFEGAVSMCNFCLKHRAETLRIINISSICGEYAMPYFAIYSATKGALTNFSLALAREWRGKGVFVTAILPGAIHTRPDVEEYIKTQGIWGRIAAKTPEYVAMKSLNASDKGIRKKVIGAANKLVYYGSALVPGAIKTALIAKKWSSTQKDAF